MKKNSRTIFSLIIALIVLCVFSGAYWYIYQSVGGQVDRTTNALIEVARQQYEKSREKSLGMLLQTTESNRAKLPSFFVPDDRIVEFIERVEGIASITGASITISTINADDLSTAAAGTIGHVKAHVDGQGSWSAVMKAVVLIERLPYSVAIDNLRVDSIGISGKAQQWRVGFDIEALSLK